MSAPSKSTSNEALKATITELVRGVGLVAESGDASKVRQIVLDTLDRELGPVNMPNREGKTSPDLETPEPKRWVLHQARHLFGLIEPVFIRWRFNVGLYGSVLRDEVGVDLDLIAWPHHPEAFPAYEMIMADLLALGLRRLPDEYRAANGSVCYLLQAPSGRIIDLAFKP